MRDPTDNLTPLARKLLSLDAHIAYEKLVIDAADARTTALELLSSATPQNLCAAPVTNEDHASAMLGALWLWHDYLDESHSLFQINETSTGSLWHAIMHRREGDFGNSKYWYARAGSHPALQVISIQAGALVSQLPADKALLRLSGVNTFGPALVDLAQLVHETPSHPLFRTAVSIQQLEWRVLFEHCAREAQK